MNFSFLVRRMRPSVEPCLLDHHVVRTFRLAKLQRISKLPLMIDETAPYKPTKAKLHRNLARITSVAYSTVRNKPARRTRKSTFDFILKWKLNRVRCTPLFNKPHSLFVFSFVVTFLVIVPNTTKLTGKQERHTVS